MLRLTQLRKQAGLSQSELARRSRLHHSTVCLVENRRLRPYGGQLDKLAAALDFAGRPTELLEEVDDGTGL